MLLTTKVTTMIGVVIAEISIIYIGVILSANHASNHDGKPKVASEMTYSSILYIIILEIIILYYTERLLRVRAYARECRKGSLQKNDIIKKNF